MEKEHSENSFVQKETLTVKYHKIEFNLNTENTPPFFNPDFLQSAFDEALKANEEGEVPVGCVFVNDIPSNPSVTLNKFESSQKQQIIIARGRNTVNKTKNATRHAEMNCIDDVHFSVLEGKKLNEHCNINK